MKLLRLPRAKVQLGVPLPWNVRDDKQQLLLSRGHVLRSENQLEALLERGAYVDLEEAKLAERSHVPSPGVAAKGQANLFGLWDELPNELYKLLDKAPETPGFSARLQDFSTRLIQLIDKDVDIALYHAVRQETAHLFFYGYSHAIHTATLCLLMARRLAWPQARMMSLVNAALTMNLAILGLQGAMAKQDVPMRESQKKQVRRHPQDAVDMLTKLGVDDPEWLTAVAQHHERPDGSGYPGGLQELNQSAVALRVTDVFMAKISPRATRPALPIKDAARALFQEDGGGPISSAIIKEFGIYPPGDVVKLASGEVGVVMRRTANAKCPIVSALTDAQGHNTTRTQRRDTSVPEHAIVASLTDKSVVARLPPERVYGYSGA